MKYKKYIVFVIAQYYPGGGLRDIEGSYDTLDEARAEAKRLAGTEPYDIVDRDTWETIE